MAVPSLGWGIQREREKARESPAAAGDLQTINRAL